MGRVVSIDGQNHTITFTNTGQNLVIAATGAEIYNLKVVNTADTVTWNSTYGIQFYNGTYDIHDISVTGANAGILINSSTATIGANVNVSGNNFGGIEVSKSAGVGTSAAQATVTSKIVNTTEEYGKPTMWTDGEDATIVDNTGMTATTAVKVGQTQYYLLAENAASPEMGTKDNPYVTVAAYNAAANDLSGKDVYLSVEGQTYTNQSLGLTNTQNTENPPKLHLTLKNCSFEGATAGGKHVYAPNVQELIVDGCSFKNNSVSDYGIDVNLCSIQDAEITIKNSTFDSTGQKSAIKVTQRKGATDHPTDITVTTPATISQFTVEGCTFNGNVCDVRIGTEPKGEDVEANTSTGAFPVTVANNTTATVVAEPYMVDKDVDIPLTTIAAGQTVSKTAETHFYQG